MIMRGTTLKSSSFINKNFLSLTAAFYCGYNHRPSPCKALSKKLCNSRQNFFQWNVDTRICCLVICMISGNFCCILYPIIVFGIYIAKANMRHFGDRAVERNLIFFLTFWKVKLLKIYLSASVRWFLPTARVRAAWTGLAGERQEFGLAICMIKRLASDWYSSDTTS